MGGFGGNTLTALERLSEAWADVDKALMKLPHLKAVTCNVESDEGKAGGAVWQAPQRSAAWEQREQLRVLLRKMLPRAHAAGLLKYT